MSTTEKFVATIGATRRGGNQLGIKQYNERLILSLIRQAGALTKADIARITHLTPQTITTIVNRLLKEGYLRKKAVIRGRIGQPSTPVEIAPDGAISVGMKIGRRSMDLVALSLNGRVVAKNSTAYEHLDASVVLDLVEPCFDRLKRELSEAQLSRLVGVGIAAPTALERGIPVIGDPGGDKPRLREAELVARVEEVSSLSTMVLNDATAACLAEMDKAHEHREGSTIYFYLSTLVGGSIVINGSLITGRTGNAGAVGAIPIELASHVMKGKPCQFIEVASLNRLEAIAARNHVPPQCFREDGGSPSAIDQKVLACFDEWCDLAADALAFASISGTSFIEAQNVVVDGVILRPLLDRLISRIKGCMDNYKLEGITPPEVRAGTIGFDARSIGAALLPLQDQFAPDNRVVLKS